MLPSSPVISTLPKSREEAFRQAAFWVQRYFAYAEAALLSPLPATWRWELVGSKPFSVVLTATSPGPKT